MASRTRRRLGIAGGVIALVVVALGVTLALLDWTLFKGPIERLVTAKTGRPFHIEGSIDVRLWPPARIVLHGVRMGNADWSKSGRDLFFADEVAATIRLLPLLRGRVVLPLVEVAAPRVALERDGDRANWNIGSGEPSQGTVAPEIDRLRVTDGEVRFDDPRHRIAVVAQVDSTKSGDPERPLAVNAKGTVFGDPFELRARGGSLLALRDTGAPWPLAGEARVGDTRASVDGSVRGVASFEALDTRFTLSGPTLADLQRLLPLALPDTPPYKLSGHLVHASGDWSVDEAKGTVGDSDVAGRATYATAPPGGARPKLVADLTSNRLDLDDLAPLLGAPPATGPGETASPKQREAARRQKTSGPVTPRTVAERKRAEARAAATGQPLPDADPETGEPPNPERKVLPEVALGTDKWPRMDADVRLRGKQIRRKSWLPIDNLDAKAVLADAKLRLEPVSFGVAGGKVDVNAVLDGGAKPVDAKAEVRFTRLGLDRLIPKLKATSGNAGALYGSMTLAGRGASLAEILGSSNGRLQVTVDGGRISNLILEVIGLDGGEVIKYLLAGDRDVTLRCAAADFPVEKGVANARLLLVDTTDTNIAGKGTIDLGREALALDLYPRPKDPSILVLRAPIHIGGTFAKPSTVPDLTEVGLRAGAAVLLGLVNPALALLPMVETGPGKDSNCAKALGEAKGWEKAKAAVGDAPHGAAGGPAAHGRATTPAARRSATGAK